MQIITVKNAILVAAVGLLATCASAATLRINVPVEARWGNTVLPAGNYTIDYSEGSPAMKVTGVGKQVTVLVSSTRTLNSDAKSSVTVVNENGTPAIRSFQSAATGKSYVFPVKKTSTVQLADGSHSAGHTPVGMR